MKQTLKIKIGFSLSALLVLLLIPLASAGAVAGDIGTACQTDSDCADIDFQAWNENKASTHGLICKASRCALKPEQVSIGTWCSTSVHCEDDTGVLQFTCDTNQKLCVGAVAEVECIDDLARINRDEVSGSTKELMELSSRCGTGLVCDSDIGVCQNDFGQGKVPSDKIGETANDIRDQIRNLINIALGFLGVAGVIVVIYGGALWMSAAGDDEKVEKAKKTIVSGLIGLVIIGIAWTIVSYVLTVTQEIA